MCVLRETPPHDSTGCTQLQATGVLGVRHWYDGMEPKRVLSALVLGRHSFMRRENS